MRRKSVKKFAAIFMAAALGLSGCGGASSEEDTSAEKTKTETEASEEKPQEENAAKDTADGTGTPEGAADTSADIGDAPELPGLTCESKMNLQFAECFNVYYYSDGYKLLDVPESARYLLVPEGKEAPEGLDEEIRVLQQPLDTIYMAATSPMALFDALDAVDTIRLSGSDAAGWSVESASQALNDGKMVFAGKYNEPDYELLLSEDCDVAIESTMILHDPKVQEMIEELGIPVFIDRSSYETHPLGRTEWIKLYGAMVDKEKEAEAFFAGQAKILDDLSDFENTEKTVTLFYINTSGSAVVRDPKDYMSSMIELGGGRNTFRDLKNDSGKTSLSITMEEFYNTAVDSDYLIYNSSIDSSVKSIDDLVAKDHLLADFKAVKEGNVWTTEKAMYQATDTIAQFIGDVHLMLTDGDPSRMVFLKKLS